MSSIEACSEQGIESRDVVMEARLTADNFGEGLTVGRLIPPDAWLWPVNGAGFRMTVTMKYTNGQPIPGVTVRVESHPVNLAGAEWRDVNGLAPRFGLGEQTIRTRIAEGVVRLGVRVTPLHAVTDTRGEAVFRVEGFHVCGNEDEPAADVVVATSLGKTVQTIVGSAVQGLVQIVDNLAEGLCTSGLVGRYLAQDVLDQVQAVGRAWKQVEKPTGMPHHITITGASLRWGGLNPPHFTHRFGWAADIRPIGTRDGPVTIDDRHYHRRGTSALIDLLVQAYAVEVRFADNLPGVNEVDPSHRNHIHVSWSNIPNEPWLSKAALCKVELTPPEVRD